MELADEIVVMNRGRVEQIGTPVDVYDRPATPFVYGFLGAANVFEGRVEGARLRVGDDWLPLRTSSAADGAAVTAFSRPHDIEIEPDKADALGVKARIHRILNVGGMARIELHGAHGGNGASPIHHYEVELPREHLRSLALAEGQIVRLHAPQLALFPAAPPVTPQ